MISVLGFDLEWSSRGIDVVGLAWEQDGRIRAQAGPASVLPDAVNRLQQATQIVGHNVLDADIPRLVEAGFPLSDPVVIRDTRLLLHSCYGHLAGTGSYDLRSMVLLLNQPNSSFPLDWKDYTNDLYHTCAMDAAAALFAFRRLSRYVQSQRLGPTVELAHRVQPIFTAMWLQGVRLDQTVLCRIYQSRKQKLEEICEKYGLYEWKGKKNPKKVPIWRSRKVLDICAARFGVRPANLQRDSFAKLAGRLPSASDAREFLEAVIDLSKGANDAHWLGKVEEDEDGLSFGKVNNDGFIYPRYDLCGSPDRAVASHPNIQNFPRPTSDPRMVKLRAAVVPLEPDHCILGVDFSSIETITNAYESQDMDRVGAVLAGRISHEGTASLVNTSFGFQLNRQQGKAINHAFDKGESPFNLASRIFGVLRPNRQQIAQCQQIYQQMLGQYPKTAQFRDELWERAADNPLVVRNSFGRMLKCFARSRYGESDGRNFARHDATKKYWCSCAACGPRRDRWKAAIAFLGRSTAFDILLTAMARIYTDRILDRYSLPYLEVHDELDFSVPREQVEEYARRAKEAFEEPINQLGGIRIPAEVKWGANWAEAH